MLKIAFKKSQKENQEKLCVRNQKYMYTTLKIKLYASWKKSVKKASFMPRAEFPIESSPILRAIGSSMSSAYQVMVEAALRRSSISSPRQLYLLCGPTTFLMRIERFWRYGKEFFDNNA